MKISRKILTVSLIGTTAVAVNAKPAMKDYKTVTQPDGTTIRIKTVGDEHLHFTITEDGNLLHLDGDGFYRLGKITADGAVETTGIGPMISGLPRSPQNLTMLISRASEPQELKKEKQHSQATAFLNQTILSSEIPKA